MVAEVSREHEQHVQSGRPLFVVIRRFERIGSMERTMDFVRQHSLPVIVQSPGFRGVYMLRDDPDTARAAVVTLFNSRDEAVRSHERILQVIREKGGDAVPPPSSVVMGNTLVMAAAD